MFAARNKPYHPPQEVANGRNVLLFNLQQDPSEEQDLSTEKEDVVNELLHRLAGYNFTAVPALQFEKDVVNSNPERHGGFWMPWRGVSENLDKDEL